MELTRRTGQSSRLWAGTGLLIVSLFLMLSAGCVVQQLPSTAFAAILLV
jgi:hypothetical protein